MFDEPVDETITIIDANGNETEVDIIFGPEDWRDVFARIIRNHYLD